MKLTAKLLAAAALAIPGVANAAYLPTGVQNNVSIATVTGGGWTQCFSQNYGAFGPSIASILSGCSAGSRLMLAGKAVGSNDLMVLAQAATSDVTFNTGTGNVTHNANGVEWYFSDRYSWGFAPGGSTVNRRSCDTNDSTSFGTGPTVNQRLCWHTNGGNMSGGWRVGAVDFLNGGVTGYEKVIYTFTGAAGVPEPATWAMMILGFAMVGGAMRRTRTETRVRYAI